MHTSQSTRFGLESQRFLESFLSKSADIRQVTFELGRKDADYLNYASQQVAIVETRAELEADLESLAKEESSTGGLEDMDIVTA